MKTDELKPETAAKIQELARVNVDSASGFRKAADVVSDPTLKAAFRGYAQERDRFATALESVLGPQAAAAAEAGSLVAQVHRWWIELRGKLTGGDDFAILAEVERGEDQIKAVYEEVILETTGNPMNDVLHEQLRAVKRTHDRVRAMRDDAKS